MTRREALQRLAKSAEWLYGDREALFAARMLLEEKWACSAREMILFADEEVSFEGFDEIEREFGQGRPLQYIIGIADFCDLQFVVREGVLIPRPETEELVRLIVSETQGGEKILDVGTGSGALAIALAKKIPSSRAFALDISEDALEIAKANARRLSADVCFLQGDMLRGVENYIVLGEENEKFDIIVSNPPYIPQRELLDMRENVTKYEPHLALFVPDEDPLLCYRELAKSSFSLLKDGGRLYFEVHENFAFDVARMLQEMGFLAIRNIKDINDKQRIVCAQKS